MKVVINKKYGGFGLSPWAVLRMCELRGVPCFLFTRGLSLGGPLRRVTPDEAEREFMWSAYTVDNPDEVTISSEGWNEMTMDQRQASNESWEKISIETGRDVKRDDPTLIQVVQELGDKANGKHAKLEIVEIPDEVKWEVSEYDGLERVEEVHQVWG